jgi:hypothetical protein
MRPCPATLPRLSSGRPLRRALAALGALVLAGCLPEPAADVSMAGAGATLSSAGSLPAEVARFGLDRAGPPARGNAAIARDILELAFRMESGRALPVLSRFEGPVTVRLAGPVPPGAATDLARLVGRLRAEAGIDIRTVTGGEAAITVEFVPRAAIQATYANVACFVVPRVAGWEAFRQARNSATTDWTTLATRERAAIFIPAEGAPQETRDCLHEELAQALGPINDLYRLSDSVFNDDNFQNTLTGFDMLALRAIYAPELVSGMAEAEVAARLPGILARLNPGGGGGGGANGGITPRLWTNAIETALGGRSALAQREAAARQAIGIASAQGWTDARAALSHYALGRLTLTRDPEAAAAAFAEAERLYRALPGAEIHVGHVAMQQTALDLTRGRYAAALARAEAALPRAIRAENAALAATLLMMRAEALKGLGRGAEAEAVRLDSEGWGRYGFGSEAQRRARMSEIALLAPRG